MYMITSSIHSYLLNTNVQLGATYKTSQISTAAYENGYKAAAGFINAQPGEVSFFEIKHVVRSIHVSDISSSQISIGVSTTQLLHNLSTALQFQPGDELILSKLNHEANSAPWVRIAERLGLTVKWWASSNPKNPTCDVADLKTLLSDKTRLVACPHTSNITGTISPIREIADAVHAHPRVSIILAPYDITI
jgi:selenocysteine lyase/cysteine desulfurase